MKAIVTKMLAPTNTLGARVKASDGDGSCITIPYDFSISLGKNHAVAARALANKIGWPESLVGGSTRNGMVWVFSDSDWRA